MSEGTFSNVEVHIRNECLLKQSVIGECPEQLITRTWETVSFSGMFLSVFINNT